MTDQASILIVDDEENLSATLAMIFKRQGYKVKTATSIRAARKLIQEETFDLAFLDLKLPDANGLSFLPELRSQFPGLPVLILTAHDKLEVATEAVRKGARDFLLKPIDPPTIIQRVKEILAEGEHPKPGRKSYTNLQKLLREQRLDSNIESHLPKKPRDE